MSSEIRSTLDEIENNIDVALELLRCGSPQERADGLADLFVAVFTKLDELIRYNRPTDGGSTGVVSQL